MTITPLPVDSTLLCDCEEPCETHAKRCDAVATLVVVRYGMRFVVCDHCAEAASRLRLTARGRL